jgi:hypothetical protein
MRDLRLVQPVSPYKANVSGSIPSALPATARKVCWFARHNTFSRAGDLRESLLHVDALSGT